MDWCLADDGDGGNATGEVKKGSQVVVERVLTAIVDEPAEPLRGAAFSAAG